MEKKFSISLKKRKQKFWSYKSFKSLLKFNYKK